MNLKHDRAAVLKKGMGLFCSKGYNSLGVDEICKVTGMTKGAFYNAYKSKEQFLYEAIALYGENNVKRIELALHPDQARTALERLQAFYSQMLEAQPKVDFTGCFINNTMSEMGFSSEIIGKASKIEFDKFIEAILPTVAEAQENGELKPDMDARQMTELLHSTFYGVLTVAKSSRDFQQGIQLLNLLFQNLKTAKNG